MSKMNLQNQAERESGKLTQESQAKLTNMINMEAYQAYYNTNESTKGAPGAPAPGTLSAGNGVTLGTFSSNGAILNDIAS